VRADRIKVPPITSTSAVRFLGVPKETPIFVCAGGRCVPFGVPFDNAFGQLCFPKSPRLRQRAFLPARPAVMARYRLQKEGRAREELSGNG
jgi:hypothetical protein